MNKPTFSNYAKLIAFFVVAVLLVVGFGFTTEGLWTSNAQSNTDDTPSEPQSNITPNETVKPPENNVPTVKIPEYFNYLTGLESTEENSRKRHFAFVLDSSAPLFGTSSCDIIAEFPTEENSTRLLAFTNTTERLSKIGSMTASRAYISNVARFFSSVIIAKGDDGKTSYESCATSGAFFDMERHAGYYYTEYSQFVYTNGDLINAGIYNANVNTTAEPDGSLPYYFVDYGKSVSKKDKSAKSVLLPFSDKNETELYYSTADGSYTFNKNGAAKNDMLTDKKVTFKNVFVLFADTVTYETSASTEMVMKTIGSGSGYYITDGHYQDITWQSDATGVMTFLDSNGEKLVINRGNSYLGFIKSIKSEELQIS